MATSYFPGNIPNRAAGWAQKEAGTSRPIWGNWWDLPNSSFGDDPRDQKWINEGKNDFNSEYYKYFDDTNGNQCF